MVPQSGSVVVTGANRGIGFAVCNELARRGVPVFMLCRDSASGRAAAGEIRAREPAADLAVVSCDLAEFDSIQTAAQEVGAAGVPIQGLVNNAGLVTATRHLSPAGIELQFAVNHLGHYLLTNLLLPALIRYGSSRIVTVSSMSHFGPPLDLAAVEGEGPKRYRRLRAYQQSKLANVQFAMALARRLEGSQVTSVAVHPGVIDTGLLGSFMGKAAFLRRLFPSPESGARRLVRLVLDPEFAGVTGIYCRQDEKVTPSLEASDEVAQESLWEASRRWTGVG